MGTVVNIKTASFSFNLKALEPIILPSYKGSTFRGGFGYAFKRVVCAIREKECTDCLLKERCVYSYVFETPPPSDTKIMRKYKAAPHPFVIEPPPERRRGYKPDDEINFRLILIGKAIDYLPYFIYTFDELGRIGIGKGRGKYELKTVKCENNPVIPAKAGIQTIYDSETKTLKPFETSALNLDSASLNFESYDYGTLTLHFLTPTRIHYNGRLTFDLEFHILIRNLLRRLSLLCYFHCGGDPSAWDFKGIIEKAKEVKVKEKNLRWYDWERYSGRQETRMKMGGFLGDITFEGNIEPFMSLIKAGEVLHVGKGTGFGLGKYRIV
ncbi:MAG: CRISPR system precrRNA processing endoribonuclease RAMP protein Cas6 [Nitrospirae bacterium]|nr:CRISPR system precrRNA processing endoribonuclease RAMP protein Cas6 [Nitrospirota bacterium]